MEKKHAAQKKKISWFSIVMFDPEETESYKKNSRNISQAL